MYFSDSNHEKELEINSSSSNSSYSFEILNSTENSDLTDEDLSDNYLSNKNSNLIEIETDTDTDSEVDSEDILNYKIKTIKKKIKFYNYKNLIEILKSLLEENNKIEYKLFYINIKYKKKEFKSNKISNYKTKYFNLPKIKIKQPIRIRDFINIFELENKNLLNINYQNIKLYATLNEISFKKKYNIKIFKKMKIENKLYYMNFYNNKEMCLIDAAYKFLNLKQPDKLFKNVNCFNLFFLELKLLLKEIYNINTIISFNEKTFNYDNNNKKNNDINLYSFNKYIGYVENIKDLFY